MGHCGRCRTVARFTPTDASSDQIRFPKVVMYIPYNFMCYIPYTPFSPTVERTATLWLKCCWKWLLTLFKILLHHLKTRSQSRISHVHLHLYHVSHSGAHKLSSPLFLMGSCCSIFSFLCVLDRCLLFHFDELMKIHSEHNRWTFILIVHCYSNSYVDMSLLSESVLYKPVHDLSRVCNKSNTKDATYGTGPSYISGSPVLTPG
jgi:hypothetical protein